MQLSQFEILFCKNRLPLPSNTTQIYLGNGGAYFSIFRPADPRILLGKGLTVFLVIIINCPDRLRSPGGGGGVGGWVRGGWLGEGWVVERWVSWWGLRSAQKKSSTREGLNNCAYQGGNSPPLPPSPPPFLYRAIPNPLPS